MQSTAPQHETYDIAIIGGALAGASSAILLLRAQPRLRVLILERSPVFTRRVGEATVEISSYFLSRVIGLTQYLNEHHLVKQGMRFWFQNEQTKTIEDASEIGGRYLARVPAYQVDRSTLDQEVLDRAVALGATVWRPASVTKVELNAGGEQTLTVKREEQQVMVKARWVVDGSGFGALISRQQGWWRANTAHPTTAVWSRWRGVKDWDGRELAEKYPQWAHACHGIRATATNHLTGRGWWAWCIPLKGGDMSVGVVFDQRMVDWPEGGSLGQRLKDFLCAHPVGHEILKDAQWMEGDVHWRKNLPYSSTRYIGDGFALVGDAGAFIDPFYSPGMDWLSFSVSSACDVILTQLRGECIAKRIEQHNETFVRSYERWFNAIYLNKYEYMGEFDLMQCAFRLDLGLYYLGVASQPYKRGEKALLEPLFSTPPSVPVYHLMRTYNRRLAAIAHQRFVQGKLGKTNYRRKLMFAGYTFNPSSGEHILRAFGQWIWLELTEGWQTWFTTKAEQEKTPVKQPALEQPVSEPLPIK